MNIKKTINPGLVTLYNIQSGKNGTSGPMRGINNTIKSIKTRG